MGGIASWHTLWCDGRGDSWMCTWQMCSKLSCRNGPKSSQDWFHATKKSGTSKRDLTKWLVCMLRWDTFEVLDYFPSNLQKKWSKNAHFGVNFTPLSLLEMCLHMSMQQTCNDIYYTVIHTKTSVLFAFICLVFKNLAYLCLNWDKWCACINIAF